mmetsp:Transcript_37738/g.79025  ORF Transcript_37738/g.79025 Transcript_37738/m.79025 type:complete len:203 (-) Transcript_37738:736-1344(-)
MKQCVIRPPPNQPAPLPFGKESANSNRCNVRANNTSSVLLVLQPLTHEGDAGLDLDSAPVPLPTTPLTAEGNSAKSVTGLAVSLSQTRKPVPSVCATRRTLKNTKPMLSAKVPLPAVFIFGFECHFSKSFFVSIHPLSLVFITIFKNLCSKSMSGSLKSIANVMIEHIKALCSTGVFFFRSMGKNDSVCFAMSLSKILRASF